MVNHGNDTDVAHMISKHEPAIFTMKGDDTITSSSNHTQNHPNIPVPLSYSSADSATEYASLFGEAIISKDTLFTATNHNNNSHNSTTSSSLNTVIMMVDHCNGHKHIVQKHDSTDAVVQENDEANVIHSTESVENPICLSLCSHQYHTSTSSSNNNNNDMKDDILDHSPSTRVFQKKSSMLLPPLSNGSASPRRETLQTVSTSIEENNTTNENRSNELFLDVIGCPCFQPNHLDYPSSVSKHQPVSMIPTDGVPNNNRNTSSGIVDVVVLPKIRRFSLFDENEKKDDDDDNIDNDEEEEEQFQLDEELMTGIIEETGAHYHITKIIVEGWIHKKGTGHDWLGSRGWKARWARLAIGYIDGYDNVEVPLLGISWYPTSTNHSTVIVLDSTVVLAVDLPNKDRPHRLEIRHAKSSIATLSKKDKHNHHPVSATSTEELPMTRTFAAPSRKARDAWVYAMSQALLSYEKDKAALRKLQWRNSSGTDGAISSNSNKNSTSPSKQRLLAQQQQQQPHSTSLNVSPKQTRDYDDIWLNDRFPPPSLPPSSIVATGSDSHRNPSPLWQHQTRSDRRSNHSNPRPSQSHTSKSSVAVGTRSKTSMMPTSIIGQDGFSTCTTPQEVMRHHQQHGHNNSRPMAMQTRSTSA